MSKHVILVLLLVRRPCRRFPILCISGSWRPHALGTFSTMSSLVKNCHQLLNRHALVVSQLRGRKLWRVLPNFSHVKMPPEEERELVPLLAVPNWHGVEPRKWPRNLADLRGPETVNNDLLYGQYGIMALTGAHLTINHLNLIRTVINKHMDKKRMFAVWRVEAPWKPVSKKAQGKRMGGGKSSIHHYATPVRAASVLVELGGHLEMDDCFFFLNSIAKRLPCDAVVISKEILEQWRKEEIEEEEKNINPISYKRVVQQNMTGCHKWITPYDHRWYGKYV